MNRREKTWKTEGNRQGGITPSMKDINRQRLLRKKEAQMRNMTWK